MKRRRASPTLLGGRARRPRIVRRLFWRRRGNESLPSPLAYSVVSLRTPRGPPPRSPPGDRHLPVGLPATSGRRKYRVSRCAAPRRPSRTWRPPPRPGFARRRPSRFVARPPRDPPARVSLPRTPNPNPRAPPPSVPARGSSPPPPRRIPRTPPSPPPSPRDASSSTPCASVGSAPTPLGAPTTARRCTLAIAARISSTSSRLSRHTATPRPAGRTARTEAPSKTSSRIAGRSSDTSKDE